MLVIITYCYIIYDQLYFRLLCRVAVGSMVEIMPQLVQSKGKCKQWREEDMISEMEAASQGTAGRKAFNIT